MAVGLSSVTRTVWRAPARSRHVIRTDPTCLMRQVALLLVAPHGQHVCARRRVMISARSRRHLGTRRERREPHVQLITRVRHTVEELIDCPGVGLKTGHLAQSGGRRAHLEEGEGLAKGRVTSRALARSGAIWRDLARSGALWRDLARSGALWRGARGIHSPGVRAR